MSTRHLLNREGVVVCRADPAPDGGNVTSDKALMSCQDCGNLTCMMSDCNEEAVMAIASRTPQGKDGLVSTIYQFVEDAPKKATRTCGPCGVTLAAQLAALTDGELRVSVDVTEGARR